MTINGGNWSWTKDDEHKISLANNGSLAISILPGGNARMTSTFSISPFSISAEALIDTRGHMSQVKATDVSTSITGIKGFDISVGINSKGYYVSVGPTATYLNSIAPADIAKQITDILKNVPGLPVDEKLLSPVIAAQVTYALPNLANQYLNELMLKPFLVDQYLIGVELYHWPADPFSYPKCFPGHTLVAVGSGLSVPISSLRLGDIVLSFDPGANSGRGELVPRRVTRLYCNSTIEWIRLNWRENGDTKELISTPGHHFLDHLGYFPTLETMISTGRAVVVLASGELADVTAERIVYSADTAHMFERAVVQSVVAGNAAMRSVELDAWQTYNFEVEELHTYVAGGVRVHNTSGLLGQLGNVLNQSLDDAVNATDGGFIDKLTDIVVAPFHVAGELLHGAVGGAKAIGFGVVGAALSPVVGLGVAVNSLASGNIRGAMDALAKGVFGVVAFSAAGIGAVVQSITSGIAGAIQEIGSLFGSEDDLKQHDGGWDWLCCTNRVMVGLPLSPDRPTPRPL